jgi:hypothetical protein
LEHNSAFKKGKNFNKKEKLFSEETLFFRVVFAFVDAELPLWFDAAPFAGVLSP